MATTSFEFPVADVHGAVEKKGVILRQKHFLSPAGKLLKKGKKELYKVTNPRDFRKKPKKDSEIQQQNLFSLASQKTSIILNAAKPENNPTQEQLDTLQQWQQRFEAQMPNTKGTQPDPLAPIDPATRRVKRYVQFPAFIRAIIYQQLKQTK